MRTILSEAGRGDDYVEIGLDGNVCYSPLHNDLDLCALAYAIAPLLNNLFGSSNEPFLAAGVHGLGEVRDAPSTSARQYARDARAASENAKLSNSYTFQARGDKSVVETVQYGP